MVLASVCMCVFLCEFKDGPIFTQEMDGYFLFHSLYLIYFYKLENQIRSLYDGIRIGYPRFGQSPYTLVFLSVSSEEMLPFRALTGTVTAHGA